MSRKSGDRFFDTDMREIKGSETSCEWDDDVDHGKHCWRNGQRGYAIHRPVRDYRRACGKQSIQNHIGTNDSAAEEAALRDQR
jgi:hypothetical protein